MIKSYLTNAICPRCNGRLWTQNYTGDYPLCCPRCEEDFYFIENANFTIKNTNPYFEVNIPMRKDVYDRNVEEISHIVPKASFIEFDDSKATLELDNPMGICDIGFDDYQYLISMSEKIMPKIRKIGKLK